MRTIECPEIGDKVELWLGDDEPRKIHILNDKDVECGLVYCGLNRVGLAVWQLEMEVDFDDDEGTSTVCTTYVYDREKGMWVEYEDA